MSRIGQDRTAECFLHCSHLHSITIAYAGRRTRSQIQYWEAPEDDLSRTQRRQAKTTGFYLKQNGNMPLERAHLKSEFGAISHLVCSRIPWILPQMQSKELDGR